MRVEIFAFILTLLAGLATGIGSIIALFAKKNNYKFLSFSLGFSAGVMLYASMVEIFSKGKIALTTALGDKKGYFICVVAFFGGMALIYLIDKLIPCSEEAVENKSKEEIIKSKNSSLLRMGIFTALALAIHNFPEGLATFMSALQGASFAVPIALAIALHNIPEGIAVSVPVYYATGSKKKAFWYSFISGLTEPIGAVIGYLILRPFINDMVMGFVFAGVAGIMVYISLDELLPSAWSYSKKKYSVIGLILGMIIMAISLVLFV